MSKVLLRPAEAPDASLVLSLIRELAEYERLLHQVEATEADLARDLFGPAPRVFATLADIDGEAAGFALWFHTYSTFQGKHGIHLEDLFVRPAFRGLGVGKALIAHLAARCVSDGLGRLQWSVLDWNDPSIRFYRALGAKPVEGWTGYRLTGEALLTLAGAA